MYARMSVCVCVCVCVYVCMYVCILADRVFAPGAVEVVMPARHRRECLRACDRYPGRLAHQQDLVLPFPLDLQPAPPTPPRTRTHHHAGVGVIAVGLAGLSQVWPDLAGTAWDGWWGSNCVCMLVYAFM